MMQHPSLPYHEPDITTILVQASFLLALNIVNALFDKWLFCGLVGQVSVGVAWGTSGAGWLGREGEGLVEGVVVELGYLGLVMLVFEGGLSTNFPALKANLFLSTAVAASGIGFPIALSFVLQYLVQATPLQAFAAGAALCSTSLGTTFTILSASGLARTRLGTVLACAAMMDDVVGLVMVQVILNLGEGQGSVVAVNLKATTIIRPLGVSAAFAVVVPLVCRFVVQPVTVMLNGVRKSNPRGVVQMVCRGRDTAFIVHTVLLIVLVTAASYAGTSNLFAAYLVGASISWWDSEVPHLLDAEDALVESSLGRARSKTLTPGQELRLQNSTASHNQESSSSRGEQVNSSPDVAESENRVTLKGHHGSIANSGSAVYHKYYATAVQRILKPFFFASIGFAIPITDMFSGEIVWRGIVYTILMLFAKLVTGLWLIRLSVWWPKVRIRRSLRSIVQVPASCFGLIYGTPKKDETTSRNTDSHEMKARGKKAGSKNAGDVPEKPATGEASTSNAHSSLPNPPSSAPLSASGPSKINKPLSLYPAAILGTAMTARGEIGFLIASLAETTGLFASSSEPRTGSSEIYLVVTWAIVLCTVIGPLGVGTLVKRVRRLQGERKGGMGDPLGIWGVS